MHFLIRTAAVSVALLPSIALASFTDVSTNHQYKAAIEWMQGEGIVEGYSDGSFHPESSINRAEFVKIITPMISGSAEINGCLTNIQVLFSDTPFSAWFTPYVCAAFRANMVSGYPDGSFRPANNISFAEAAKIIKVAFDVPWTTPGSACMSDYNRWHETSGQLGDDGNPYWWQQYVCALQQANALAPSYRAPEQLVTRAEMAEMIYRLNVSINASSSFKSSVQSSKSSSSVRSSSRSSSRSSTAVLSSRSSSKISSKSSAQSSSKSIAQTSGPLDLSLALEGSATLPEGSRVVFYEVTLTNHGPADMAAPLFVRVFNSGNMTFLPDNSDDNCVGDDSGDVYCAIHDLFSGQSESVVVKYEADFLSCSDSMHVGAMIDQAPVNDTNAANNTATSWETESGC